MNSAKRIAAVQLAAVCLCLLIVSPMPANDPRMMPRTTGSREIPPQLCKVLPTVCFEGVALGDIVEFIRDVGGMKIAVDWAELERLGITRDRPIHFTAHNIALGSVMRFVLWDAAGPGQLDYAIGDGFLHISTTEALRSLSDVVMLRPGEIAGAIKMSDPLIVLGCDEKGFCAWPDPMPVPPKGIRIDKQPLGLVLDVFRFDGVKNIWADERGLAKAGVTSKTLVTVAIPGKATIQQTLDAIVASIPGREPVGFAVVEGVVVISTRNEIDHLLAR